MTLELPTGFTLDEEEPQTAPIVPQSTAGQLPSGFSLDVAEPIEAGNIDLNTRPMVSNQDGSISTVRSISFNQEGREILLPTVSDDGRIMTDDEAIGLFQQTGKHLGIFNNAQEATDYAKSLSTGQDTRYLQAPLSAELPPGFEPDTPSFDDFIDDTWAAIKGVPSAFKAAAASLAEGSDPKEISAAKDWSDRAIAQDRVRREANSQVEGASNPYVDFMGVTIDRKNLRNLPQQAAFSITTMATSLLAGLSAGIVPVPGARVAAFVGAGAMTAYRMDASMVLRDLRDGLDKEAILQIGRPLYDEEFVSLSEAPGLQDAAKQMGLQWGAQGSVKENVRAHAINEAGWEVAGNAIMFGAGKALFKYAKNSGLLKSILVGAGGMAGEVASETETQIGQQSAEVRLGLIRGEEERSYLSLKDQAESFREVAGPTLLTAGVMGAATYGAGRVTGMVTGERDQTPQAQLASEMEQAVEGTKLPDAEQQAFEASLLKKDLPPGFSVDSDVVEPQVDIKPVVTPEAPVADIQAAIEPERTPLHTSIVSKLTATGMDQPAAETNADIVEKMYESLSKKTGLSVDDLYERYGLDIAGEIISKDAISEPVYSGYEREDTGIREPLGVEPVKDQIALDFDMEPPASLPEAKTQIQDNFNVRYKQVEIGQLRTGITKVESASDAAHVLAPIRKHAQETSMALVLDKDGSILNVVRHSKGLKDSALISPVEIAGAVAGTEGAASVWFAHNHPSGMADPSSADVNITKRMTQALEGTNIDVKGHIVIGATGKASELNNKGQVITEALIIKPMPRKGVTSVTERMIRKNTMKDAVTVNSPDTARKVVSSLGTKNGIVLLDNRHKVIGVITMSPEEMSALRKNDQPRRILKALDETNAAATIVVADNNDNARNIGNYLARLGDLRALDAFVHEADGSLTSKTEKGRSLGSAEKTFYQEPAKQPTFYSPTLRAVEGLSQAKGSAKQMLAMIKKQPGVKQEELDWIGLEDWAAGQKSVTKDQIAEYVRASQIEVQEVTKGEQLTAPGELVPPGADTSGETKFAGYQLPGGENYRELLLTLPEQERRLPEGYEVQETADRRFTLVGPDGSGTLLSASTIETAQDEAIKRTTARPDVFAGGHYYEANILAHIRFNERTDTEGKRVLFVEEVQSDWHQAGRKTGYKGVEPSDSQVREFFDLREGADPADFRAEMMEHKDFGKAPNAPFKTTWPLLAMKRMIRYASENGFDSIAWTTGEQQADRYDLSKQVDEIGVTKNSDGTFDIEPIKNNQGLTSWDNVHADKIADYVGKDLAEKIKSQVGETAKYSGVDLKVGGEGMKGFYDNILPKTVNKYVKKWGGKVGQASMPDAAVKPKQVESNLIYAAKSFSDNGDTKDDALIGMRVAYPDAHESDLAKAIEGAYPVQVHNLPITDKMRESAMQGQPLFQEKLKAPGRVAQDKDRGSIEIGEDRTQFNIKLLEKADKSTFIHEFSHYILEVTDDLVTKGTADKSLQADYSSIRQWLKAKPGKAITRAQHEQFAKGFEKYLAEGKAPTPMLKKAFDNFKAWMLDIYKSLVNMDVELTDEVRGTFDRMLTGEDRPPDVKPSAAPAVTAPTMQPRLRGRPASVKQMRDIANNPDPDRLGVSPTPDTGAPMVSIAANAEVIPESDYGKSDKVTFADGTKMTVRYAVVEADQVIASHDVDGKAIPAYTAVPVEGEIRALNNGRTAALQGSYRDGKADAYREGIAADTDEHGVSVEAIDGKEKPILIRIYNDEENARTDLGRISNVAAGLQMSATEKALADAGMININTLSLYAGGDITSAANREFVTGFMRVVVPENERSELIDRNGFLNKAGIQRIRAALFAKAYGDTDIVTDIVESADTNIAGIGNALMDVAASWAGMREAAEAGQVNPDIDVTGNLLEAVNLVRRSRSEGKSIYDLLGQADILSGSVHPFTESFVRFFYHGEELKRARGRDKIANILRDYVDMAMQTTAGKDMFGQQIAATDITGEISAKLRAQEAPAPTADILGARPSARPLKPEGIEAEPRPITVAGRQETGILAPPPVTGKRELDNKTIGKMVDDFYRRHSGSFENREEFLARDPDILAIELENDFPTYDKYLSNLTEDFNLETEIAQYQESLTAELDEKPKPAEELVQREIIPQQPIEKTLEKPAVVRTKTDESNQKLATRLRGFADTLEKQIKDKYRDRPANTPKRVKEAASARNEGDRLSRTQQALYNLADMHETGTVPDILKGVKSKKAIYDALSAEMSQVDNGYHSYYLDTGKPRENATPEALALWDLVKGKSAEETKRDEIKRMSADLVGTQIPGFFPTPKAVLPRMIEAADIEPGMSVLEPEAGKGDIADAILKAEPDANLSVIELIPKLQEILKLKNHNVVGDNFLEHTGKYDRIIMNPPFEKGQDMEHVQHAFSLLNPGGRIVAITSPSPFFSSNKKSQAFREWFEENDGQIIEELESGTFQDPSQPRTTGVSSRLIMIDKPGVAKLQQAAVPADTIKLEDIPAGMVIKRKYVASDTGRTVSFEQDATEAITEVSEQLDRFKSLLECLRA